MKRYELKCYMCNQTIGYISWLEYSDPGNEIKATSIEGKKFPVCCPICENRRLTICGDIK